MDIARNRAVHRNNGDADVTFNGAVFTDGQARTIAFTGEHLSLNAPIHVQPAGKQHISVDLGESAHQGIHGAGFALLGSFFRFGKHQFLLLCGGHQHGPVK